MRRPGYDRKALAVGMAHLGVGAFHRCHQAEFTDDALEQRLDRWGVVGINIRPPRLADSLGRQDGLYTRLLRDGDNVDARVIGCLKAVVDSEDSPEPALATLAAPEIDVVTMTVTEKGYCHLPATGEIDLAHPDIVHDLAHPERPRSVPGLVAAAIERRMLSHRQPISFVSCDNIPSNGAILGSVVRALAERRGGDLLRFIDDSVAFPRTMVDRIVPPPRPPTSPMLPSATAIATPRWWSASRSGSGSSRTASRVARRLGRCPELTFVDDVMPFELIKMRVLNAAQTSFAISGCSPGTSTPATT